VIVAGGGRQSRLFTGNHFMAKANKAFVLFGAPGCGKGTLADKIVAQFKYVHVATGDLFRENLKNNTPLGQLAKGYMEKGALVPDEVTASMLKDRLQRGDEAVGYILDGFPRTMPQAEMLDKILQELGIKLSGVVYIRTSDDLIISRLSNRQICKDCQAPYHMVDRPPKQTGICDRCGGPLYQRADDKAETVKARLNTFHAQTVPLVEFYRKRNLLKDVDGDKEFDEKFAQASGFIREF
jgi:adenylate kinase